MRILNPAERLLGWLCKGLLTPKQGFYLGSSHSDLGICTLASFDLFKALIRRGAGKRAAVIGTLYTENEGIKRLLEHLEEENQSVSRLVLCGIDPRGHRPGQALLALRQNGVDGRGRIIGAVGAKPYLPHLKSSTLHHFRNRVSLIDLIGHRDPEQILKIVG